jgi:hypothetical protein
VLLYNKFLEWGDRARNKNMGIGGGAICQDAQMELLADAHSNYAQKSG